MDKIINKILHLKFLVIFSFSFFLFFSFQSFVSAATIYVSNSISNGYNTGNNSNTYVQSQSKTTPKLTIAGAIAVALSGDTIVINNGTYVEASYLNPGVSNLTINPESEYGVTVQVSGTPSYLIVPAASGLNLGKLILDGQNIVNDIIHPGIVFSGMTINGTRMLNFKQAAINDNSKMTNLTMTGGWLIDTSTDTNYAKGINLVLGNSTNSINNGTINITTSATGVGAISVSSTQANTTSINNISININQTNSAKSVSAIYVGGSSSLTISDNNISISGSNIPSAIVVPTSATVANNYLDINNNIAVATNGTASSGYGIAIGDESQLANQNINNPIIRNNTVTGFNHGIGFFYGSNNGLMLQNTINKGTTTLGGTIGFFSKGGQNNIIYLNLATGGNMTGGALRSKGDTNGSFINNTVLIDSNLTMPIYVTSNSADNKNSTGEYFANNNIYCSLGVSCNAVSVDASNTASFLNNNYYNNFLEPYPFNYSGVTYNNFLNWKSNIESTATNYNPDFSNISEGNYGLNYLSPLIDIGSVTSITTDYLNNPIYGTPDIGRFEYQPPHSLLNSDTIDIGAGARIYADGKFRDLGATNAIPAHLKITPQGGSFTTYDATTTRPAYLDITNITNWTNTHKAWTESNAETSNMITDHTIGDLNNNKYYTISVTGATASNIVGINGTTCNNAVCKSDSNGSLSFEYTGGYSTHTFDILEDTTPPVISLIGVSSINVYQNSTYTDSGATATDDIDGDITGDIVVVSNVNTAIVGAYTVTYNVTDSSGNHATEVTRIINVQSRPHSSGGNYSKQIVTLPKYFDQTYNSNSFKFVFTKNLQIGFRNNEVKELQKYLNTHGFLVDKIGIGSVGNETNYFGKATKEALGQFQIKNNIIKSKKSKSYGVFGPATRKFINKNP